MQASNRQKAEVDEAANWLASMAWEAMPYPLVPAIREKFGLSVLESCVAIREGRMIRAGRN